MNTSITGPQGFTAWHLAWLNNNDLLPNSITELGPMVDMPEAEEAIIEYLTSTEGVLEDRHELTESGKQLLNPLADYQRAWWGVILLHGQRQSFKIDIDDQLAEWGLQYSINDIPRVFFLITLSNNGKTLTTAVRFGDEMSIAQRATTHATLNRDVAYEIMKISDPSDQWKIPSFGSFIFPQRALREAGYRNLPDDESSRRSEKKKLERVLIDNGAQEKSVKTYLSILSQKCLATADVLLSTNSNNATFQAVSLGFYEDYGKVLMHPEVKGGHYFTRIAPLDTTSLTEALKSLSELDIKPRLKF